MPTQARCPAGHAGWHWPATHSTLPPVGAWHGSHEAPQLVLATSLAQLSSQRCMPSGHTQLPSLQVESLGQSLSAQQLPGGTHSPWQSRLP
jgi:hypothetical protein